MRNRLLLCIAVSGLLACWCNKSPTDPGNSKIGPSMVHIEGGQFQMGAANLDGDEQPIHTVKITSFYMDATDVTQGQYQTVMGVNPSSYAPGGSASRPVESVTWFDAVLYCNSRSKMDGKDTVYSYAGISGPPGSGCSDLANLSIDLSKNGYRLPTEAEWEYACRAGSTADYYWGQSYPPQTTADTALINTHAWWWYNNNGSGPVPVSSKPANAWGLYDMAGNVWQWCNDWYDVYSSGSQTDPTGSATGIYRTFRGGAWDFGDNDLCAGYRNFGGPAGSCSDLGFRCVRR